LKLKKLIAVEIASAVIILVVILIMVEVTPYLASANQNNQIGMYNQKEFAKGEVTITKGQITGAQFNYSTYDPAILIVDLKFQSWQTPGHLSLYCNGIIIATINASPDNPNVRFSTISVSGWDWVKPPSINSYTYGNEITFISDPDSGYEGDFGYQISIRGSR
jgi:hypothetical protein